MAFEIALNSLFVQRGRQAMTSFFIASLIGIGMTLQAEANKPPAIDTSYEPSPAQPFGKPNPAAPPALKDFAFFIGAFECQDSRFGADGSTISFPAIWNGKYFMNGHGIQDQYRAPGFYTSNIRLFDERENVWKVTFFSEPGYSTGIWTGNKSGEDIVLTRDNTRPDGTTTLSKLTFYEISADSFRWRGETIDGDTARVNWTSDCQRRQ